jgi:hypothetical protein
MTQLHPSLESIQFQKTDLFVGITNCIEGIRKLSPKLDDKKFYKTPQVQELSDLIKKYTGITFEFAHHEHGPAVYIPRLDQHIFDAPGELEYLKEAFPDFDQNYDLRRVLKLIDKDIIHGTVDLKTAKVSGVFADIKCKMFLPKDYLFNTKFLNEELSAIVLHELGHVFTSFEYLSRSVATNQSLAVMLKMMDKSVKFEDRKVVFGKAKEKLGMSEEAYKLIENEKDINKVTMVVMGEAIRESKSELGASVYDLVSCEYLADQFAARHGAGKYLVTALDKLMDGGWSGMFFTVLMTTISYLMLPAVFFIMTGSLPVAGVAFVIFSILNYVGGSYDDTHGIYDNNYMRYSRVKHQMVQQLKDPNTDPEEKKVLVTYIDEIDPIIKKNLSDTNVKLRNKIAMFFSSEHKRDFEYMKLQKDLELIGNNDLYVMSEKLKLI